MNNCTFTENMGRNAGGVSLYRGKARVSNSTFTGNKGYWAGGIAMTHSKARVINSTFTENKGEWAGGISLQDSETHVINSALTGNRGRDGGALALRFNCHVTTERCHFLQNIATDKGGAVFVNEGEYQDSDSVFADNVGGEGGKIQQDACN